MKHSEKNCKLFEIIGRPVCPWHATVICVLGLFFTVTASCKGTDSSSPAFSVVLISAESKQPIQSARIILAPKTVGQPECTIDTSLTEVSNERGEILIPILKPGDYVVFYNVSGRLDYSLNGKVVNYDPVDHGQGNSPAQMGAIRRSLGLRTLTALKGGNFVVVDGKIVINGHFYTPELDLAMISMNGELMTVHAPTGNTPVKIEIKTDLSAK